MKKLFACVLALALLLCGCGGTAPVKVPLTEAQIDAIPIATADMTVEEWRQICLDYFKLQLEFPWTPARSFSFEYKTSGETMSREKDVLYAGLPYVSGSYGNLYRVMKYYDSKTGVISVVGEDQEFAGLIGNQCSNGSGWAWARVINNTTFQSTISMTQANGCIKLGPYEYDTSISEFTSTRSICNANGRETMYQSYALWQPADGMVYYHRVGHVQMVSKKPNVVYNEDGTIDGEKSTVWYMDQTSKYGELTSIQTEENGELIQQGNVDKEITFAALFDKGYVPFTFAEFIGEGEFETPEVWVDGYTLPENDVVLSELSAGKIQSNYIVSDVRLCFKNKRGKEIATVWCPIDRARKYSYSLKDAFTDEQIAEMAQKKNVTVDIVVRIGTGEKVTVYSGTFKE